MEIAHATVGDRNGAIRELKKAQDLLGEVHDRQELVDNLIETSSRDDSDVSHQVALLKQVIDAENHDLHGRYLARRIAIIDICHGERRQLHKMSTRSMVAAGALAITSGFYARLR